jgi:hypothetical protein
MRLNTCFTSGTLCHSLICLWCASMSCAGVTAGRLMLRSDDIDRRLIPSDSTGSSSILFWKSCVRGRFCCASEVRADVNSNLAELRALGRVRVLVRSLKYYVRMSEPDNCCRRSMLMILLVSSVVVRCGVEFFRGLLITIGFFDTLMAIG